MVPSAKLLRVDSVPSSRAVLKITGTGPSVDPWGAPLVTGLQLAFVPLAQHSMASAHPPLRSSRPCPLLPAATGRSFHRRGAWVGHAQPRSSFHSPPARPLCQGCGGTSTGWILRSAQPRKLSPPAEPAPLQVHSRASGHHETASSGGMICSVCRIRRAVP